MVDINEQTTIVNNGWVVLQRIQKTSGGNFIATAFFESHDEAKLFASIFDNVVAIEPVEWEE